MPQTLKTLRGGHIASGLPVRACVLASVRNACRILGTMSDRVLKFHIWIHHQKLADPCFLWSELSPFLELCAFVENHNESLSARYLKKYLS